MKRIDLIEIRQKGRSFYFFVSDPRLISKLLPDVKDGEEQEAQRPWVKKKVKEISDYVAGKVKMNKTYNALGLIPNCPILDIREPLKVQSDKKGYFILLPENLKEFNKYTETVHPIDGQHRLRSFMGKYMHPDFKESEIYEMGFILFEGLSKNERRELFMVTNEKQDKVPSNLIRSFKKWLGLLNDEDDKIFNIVEGLHSENFSPLKGKIILGSAKITNGFKENQVSKIIKKQLVYDTVKALNDNQKIKVISNYVRAWEEVYGIKVKDKKHTLTKISGFRYMMCFFSTVYESLRRKEKPANIENIKEIIQTLYNLTGGNAIFEDEHIKLAFRGEGATTKLAKKNNELLEKELNKKDNHFDPGKAI